jgi:hypothetical protein
VSETEDEIQEEGLYEHYSFTADPGQEQMRVDKWLMHKIANASLSKIQSGIESVAVLVKRKTHQKQLQNQTKRYCSRATSNRTERY